MIVAEVNVESRHLGSFALAIGRGCEPLPVGETGAGKAQVQQGRRAITQPGMELSGERLGTPVWMARNARTLALRQGLDP